MVLDKIVELAGGAGHATSPCRCRARGTFAVEAMITTLRAAGRQAAGADQRRLRPARAARSPRSPAAPSPSLETPEDTPPDLGAARRDARPPTRRSPTSSPSIARPPSGILNPDRRDRRASSPRHGRRLLVDSMSAFGALRDRRPADPLDALAASSNKCLEGVPGLGFVVCRNDGAGRRARATRPPWCSTCSTRARRFEKTGQYRFTPPIHVIVALGKAIEEHAAEGGVAGRGKRYRDNCQGADRRHARAWASTPCCPIALQAPIIVTFHMPTDPQVRLPALL